VCVIYLYIFNFENYYICYQPAAAALRRCKFSNSNVRALERERERESKRAREREREREMKNRKGKKNANATRCCHIQHTHPPK
jgi:hypothetical protein